MNFKPLIFIDLMGSVAESAEALFSRKPW